MGGFVDTYDATAGEHYEETANGTGSSHHPGETNEQYDSEDILYAGQVTPDEGAHSRATGFSRARGRFCVRIRGSGYRVAVVCQTLEESGHSRSIVEFLL